MDFRRPDSRRTLDLTLADWLAAAAKTAGFLGIAAAVVAAVGAAGRPASGRLADTEITSAQCKALVQSAYEDRWDRTCAGLGLEARCLLPLPVAGAYSADRQAARAECAED